MWKKRNTLRAVAAAGATVLAATLACHALPPLPPVDAPLAPAAPGTRFAPNAPPTTKAPLPDLPPASTGTHVTTALDRADGSQIVAVWGDPRLWERRGKHWRPAPGLPRLTADASEVVALSKDGDTREITVTTRRNGQFTARRGAWAARPRPNVPYDANTQALAAYRGALFAATLNDGLVLRDNKGTWSHLAPPVISTNAPRQFVVWRGDLYVRHGNGIVDRFDGRTWATDVLTKSLPRHQASALATDGETLFVAQWGGWSETRDGVTVENRFPDDLRNVPVTALLPTGGTLFIGTQGRGLAEWDRMVLSVTRWNDERSGIGDDWITALARSPSGVIVAGTFVSGAFTRGESSADRWQPVAGTETDCVTAAVPAATDTVLVGLRRGGVYRAGADGSGTRLVPVAEAQCLLPDPRGRLVWIGTRTGIETVTLP